MADETIEVTLDVAGFYFSHKVRVAPNSTIEDVMEAVRRETSTSLTARFQYGTRFIKNKRTGQHEPFVSRISIQYSDKKDPPKSRQTKEPKPIGIYAVSDGDLEEVLGVGLPNEVSIKNILLAWQYYVYDRQGTDYARSRKGQLNRKIVSFSKSGRDEGENLQDGDVIVWRLVTILKGPTRLPGTKQLIVEKSLAGGTGAA